MEHNKEIVEYFRNKGVSAIFLFRRNLLRRMISVLANSYDRDAKLLNGTHKSHVHSTEEVSIYLTSLWVLIFMCMIVLVPNFPLGSDIHVIYLSNFPLGFDIHVHACSRP